MSKFNVLLVLSLCFLICGCAEPAYQVNYLEPIADTPDINTYDPDFGKYIKYTPNISTYDTDFGKYIKYTGPEIEVEAAIYKYNNYIEEHYSKAYKRFALLEKKYLFLVDVKIVNKSSIDIKQGYSFVSLSDQEKRTFYIYPKDKVAIIKDIYKEAATGSQAEQAAGRKILERIVTNYISLEGPFYANETRQGYLCFHKLNDKEIAYPVVLKVSLIGLKRPGLELKFNKPTAPSEGLIF